MGSERGKQRQYVYLSLACVILFMASACVASEHVLPGSSSPPRWTRSDCNHLVNVRSFIDRGDFEGAMKACQEILDRSPKTPPGDEALLIMGMLNVYYANPKKDYGKALGYFLRVEREFPASSLVEEAKTWAGVLQAFEKARQVDLEVEKRKKELGN